MSGSSTPEEDRARAAYERICRDLLAATGKACVSWEELTDEGRDSWVRTVIELYNGGS